MPPKKVPAHDAPQRSATSHDVVSPAVRGPRILAFAGQKGGVGKSTLTISVAVEAQERGLKVLVIDADPQGTSIMWQGLASMLGTRIPLVVATTMGVHSREQIPEMAAPYDLVLIDCPPHHNEVQRAAMVVSGRVILPVSPGPPDVLALRKSIELVAEARRVKPALEGGVVITRVQPRTTLARELRRELADIELPVLRTELGFRTTYQQMVAAGMGPTTYEPDSAAAREVRALCDELGVG